MRTTIDLPEELFRRVKARAALEGLKLKELIARYVQRGLLEAPGRLEAGGSAPEPPSETVLSALDLMREGCGLVRSGVPDLASNPKHMEGFGRE